MPVDAPSRDGYASPLMTRNLACSLGSGPGSFPPERRSGRIRLADVCGFRHQERYVARRLWRSKTSCKTTGGTAATAKDIKTELDAAIEKACVTDSRTSHNSFTSITFHGLPAVSQRNQDSKREGAGDAATPAEKKANGNNENGKPTAIERVCATDSRSSIVLHPVHTSLPVPTLPRSPPPPSTRSYPKFPQLSLSTLAPPPSSLRPTYMCIHGVSRVLTAEDAARLLHKRQAY